MAEPSVGVARRPQQAHQPEQPMATADTRLARSRHAQGILTARPTGNPARMPAAGTQAARGGRGARRTAAHSAGDRGGSAGAAARHAARRRRLGRECDADRGRQSRGAGRNRPRAGIAQRHLGRDPRAITERMSRFSTVRSARCSEPARIDPARIAIAGFSDGASLCAVSRADQRRSVPRYHRVLARLCIARANRGRAGNLHLVTVGKTRCCRSSAAAGGSRCRLRSLGYKIDYREFVGGHVVPIEMVEAALRASLPECQLPIPL